jgi:hypothetical protein
MIYHFYTAKILKHVQVPMYAKKIMMTRKKIKSICHIYLRISLSKYSH